MEEINIKFLDIANIKFLGNKELIGFVKEYYPGLEDNSIKSDYVIKLNDRVLPRDVNIPKNAKFSKSFAGPRYYSWKDEDYNLAYSPPEERGGSHLVLKKGNFLQVSFHEGESPKQVIGISREILTYETLKQGYMPIHAAVVSKDNKGYVFFGDKNRGKSTSLFSSIIFDGAKPMSSDIGLVKKDSNGWKVIGWPWTVTIAQSYFDMINRKPMRNTVGGPKIKYYPEDFCKEFNTQWVWEQELGALINVNLDPDSHGELKEISSDELKERLTKYGREEWWEWNDVFGLGEKQPVYNYEDISKTVKGKTLTGDIIPFFKERAEIER